MSYGLHTIGQALVNLGLRIGRDARGIDITIGGETWHYRQDRGGTQTWLVQPERQVCFDGQAIARVEY